MLALPPYQPVFERLLAFAAGPDRHADVARARVEYQSVAGEAFEEDRSYEARTQAFLDWYIFDRAMEPGNEPPVRAYAIAKGLGREEALQLRLLSRTTHGLFVAEKVTSHEVRVRNMVTDAVHTVPVAGPLEGLAPGDIFEARLVPWEGRLAFSGAFLFHPRELRRRIEKEIRRRARAHVAEPVQELVFMLARMASRAEHYRYVPIASIYDFERPPPKIETPRMRFDHDSVAARLRKAPRIPN